MGQYVKCKTISITINVCSFYPKICLQKQLLCKCWYIFIKQNNAISLPVRNMSLAIK